MKIEEKKTNTTIENKEIITNESDQLKVEVEKTTIKNTIETKSNLEDKDSTLKTPTVEKKEHIIRTKKLSKNQKTIKDKFSKQKLYTLEEAIELLKTLSFVKFDSSIDASINFNLNLKNPENIIRSNVILPFGNGKRKKVLAITTTQQEQAKKAKATWVRGLDVIEEIKNKKWFDFDHIVITNEVLPHILKIASLLGPRGLMPTKKNNTVTDDIEKVINDLNGGLVYYKLDKSGVLSISFGKLSFENKKLCSNFKSFYDSILKNKPKSAKSNWIKSVFVSSTMGPGLKIKV